MFINSFLLLKQKAFSCLGICLENHVNELAVINNRPKYLVKVPMSDTIVACIYTINMPHLWASSNTCSCVQQKMANLLPMTLGTGWGPSLGHLFWRLLRRAGPLSEILQLPQILLSEPLRIIVGQRLCSPTLLFRFIFLWTVRSLHWLHPKRKIQNYLTSVAPYL